MRFKNNFFNIGLGIIMTLVVILLITYIAPTLKSIVVFISSILFPFIISGLFFYLLRPMRDFLESQKMPRRMSIMLLFCVFILFITILITMLGPAIQSQISEFFATPKEKIQQVENKTIDVMNLFNIFSVSQEQMRQNLIEFLQTVNRFIVENIAFTISSIATIASYFIITPFILFYLLKDDHDIFMKAFRFVPASYEKGLKTILYDIDDVLSTYITGQVLISLIVGALIFVGYASIGLNYSLLLAFIAFFFNLIPFFGPLISTIPALFIGLSQSPIMGLEVIAVVAIVHLLDFNLISPRIVGHKLQIHPITIIILLISSVSIGGFLGLFLVIPLYAITKVILKDLYEMKHHLLNVEEKKE